MNWYKKIARFTDDSTVQEIHNLVEKGIWLEIINSKKKLTQQTANRALQQVFINCENSARQISNNIKMENLPAANESIKSLKGYLTNVCQYINCNTIKQNVENVRIMVNDLIARNKKQPSMQPQPPQQVVNNPMQTQQNRKAVV